MRSQRIQPTLDRRKGLDALSFAVQNCKDHFTYDDVAALKLTCKELRDVADKRIRRLQIHESAELRTLRPALLQNLRSLFFNANMPFFEEEKKKRMTTSNHAWME